MKAVVEDTVTTSNDVIVVRSSPSLYSVFVQFSEGGVCLSQVEATNLMIVLGAAISRAKKAPVKK